MVGDAAGVAGAFVGAEGLVAGVGAVAHHQEGDGENLHGGALPQGFRDERQVNEFPDAVEADGAATGAVEGVGEGRQDGRKGGVKGILGRVVKVAERDDVPLTALLEGIRHLSEPVHGCLPPNL